MTRGQAPVSPLLDHAWHHVCVRSEMVDVAVIIDPYAMTRRHTDEGMLGVNCETISSDLAARVLIVCEARSPQERTHVARVAVFFLIGTGHVLV
jgi:hypothetical protein